MVSFRGQNFLKPRPDWSPLGVKFKISDEHPRLFRMGVPPPPGYVAVFAFAIVVIVVVVVVAGGRSGGDVDGYDDDGVSYLLTKNA